MRPPDAFRICVWHVRNALQPRDARTDERTNLRRFFQTLRVNLT